MVVYFENDGDEDLDIEILLEHDDGVFRRFGAKRDGLAKKNSSGVLMHGDEVSAIHAKEGGYNLKVRILDAAAMVVYNDLFTILNPPF